MDMTLSDYDWSQHWPRKRVDADPLPEDVQGEISGMYSAGMTRAGMLDELRGAGHVVTGDQIVSFCQDSGMPQPPRWPNDSMADEPAPWLIPPTGNAMGIDAMGVEMGW